MPAAENPYIHAATRDNTRKAYQKDVQHFIAWGGLLPSTSEQIIQYLSAHANSHNSRTLKRHLTALRQWHTLQGFPDPTAYPAVKKTLKGIEEIHGKPVEKALTLTLDDLKKMVGYLESKGDLISLRNNALIQVGFFGAFRRSELVAIEFEHLTFSEQGVEIFVPQSKTHNLAKGESVTIPYGNEKICAVRALKQWLDISGTSSGALFCVTHKSHVVLTKALKPASVSLIIKEVARHCHFKDAECYSAHSLRRGFATMAAPQRC